MAQVNPFADLIPAQPAAQTGAPPARIYGGPKTVDPLEQARFGLAVNSDARAAAAAERADATAQRAAAAEERKILLDQKKLQVDSRLTENEGKTTAFYNRALGANRDFESSGVADDPRGYLAQTAADILPEGITNAFSSPQRQKAEQSKRDFIAASLRYESGAAISPAEFDKQDKIFFPQPNEGPEVIAQKARARQRVIESFQIGAGRGAEQVNALQGGNVQFNDQVPAQRSDAVNLTAEQKAAFQALAQSGASPQSLQALANGFGLKASDEELQGLAQFYTKPENRSIAPTVNVDNEVQAINPNDGAAGAFARGVANTGSLGFVNRLGALADAVGGENYDEALDRRRGYDAYDEQNNPLARGVGQFAGGFAVPLVGSATAANLGRNGAAAGALYSLGNSYGDASSRALEVGSGALAGGALGYGLGRGAEWLAARAGNVPPGGGGGGSGAELMAAAGRLNEGVPAAQQINPLPADVGGPMTRRLTAFAAQGPLSAGPVIRGGQRLEENVAGARDRIAASVGSAMQPVEAGEAAQQGARTYIDQSRQQVGRLYDRARETAGAVKPTPEQALATVDANLRELAETPNTSAPVTKALENLRGDLSAEGGLSIDALRRLRTNVRGLAQTDDLRGTDFQRRAGQVLDAISEDITNGLPPKARAQFRAADQAHRERLETIDEVIKPIIGGKNDKAFAPEKVFSNLQNATRSDSARLRRFMDTLPSEEQASVRATVIGQLGKASAGTQGAEGNSFSASQFLTHWNQLTPRAKDVLFKGEARDALNDLAAVADGTKQAQGYANRSNTGSVANVAALLGIGAYSPTTAAISGAAQLISGRLLASPAVARWLARPANTPQQVANAARRLSVIATRQPEIANDLLPIQQALSTSVSKAAAEDQKPQRR